MLGREKSHHVGGIESIAGSSRWHHASSGNSSKVQGGGWWGVVAAEVNQGRDVDAVSV